MPEEVLYKTEEQLARTEIATELRDAADQFESGDVRLVTDTEEQTVTDMAMDNGSQEELQLFRGHRTRR